MQVSGVMIGSHPMLWGVTVELPVESEGLLVPDPERGIMTSYRSVVAVGHTVLLKVLHNPVKLFPTIELPGLVTKLLIREF